MKTTTSPSIPSGAHLPATTARRSTFVRRSLNLTSLFAVAALAGGCATRYDFGVDAIQRPAQPLAQYSYRLVDARPSAKSGDPVFANVAKDVQTALSSRGMYAAPAGTQPELIVEVDFGVSAPRIERSVRTEPVYLPMPTPSQGLRGGLDTGSMLPRHLGEREIVYTFTTYEKFLRLTARTSGPSEAPGIGQQVWSVLVTNGDQSNDLAQYSRLMVAAAMDTVGLDTGKEKRVVLTGRDGRVTFVARGMGSS